MSERFPGGFITQSPPVPTATSASGVWTLDQQEQLRQAGQWPVNGPFNYIEDVFSTYLYTGNGATQTITNGVDLAGKGGLTWFKSRASVSNHFLFDSARGTNKYVRSQLTNPEATSNSDWISSFNSDGFSLGSNAFLNTSSESMVNWTFRKQPKFFDVVTYTGTGSAQTIAHNLGSVPGCIIVKATSIDQGWPVYHRSLGGADKWLVLNSTTSTITSADYFGTPTSTTFTVVSDNGTNGAGVQYVAYLFAHDAGGFGLSGAENVVSCGSFGLTGFAANVELGWEPQWIMFKDVSGEGGWFIYDTMRGWSNGPSDDASLQANLSASEGFGQRGHPTATGFRIENYGVTGPVIYIAIRRGPMKVPTLGTSVFSPIASTSPTGTVKTTGFPVDTQIQAYRLGGVSSTQRFVDRLRGVSTNSTGAGPYLASANTNAEVTPAGATLFWDNTGFQQPSSWDSSDVVFWSFRRAPSFFDEVCYTGTGAARTVAHNLTVAPELMIVKGRTTPTIASVLNWVVYPNSPTQYLYLNAIEPSNAADANWWNSTAPTSSVFSIGGGLQGNEPGTSYVAYLFASCLGVSKVGSYTGTGTTQAIACGFTAGARFVMIKRTDAAGDWYVWDSARGIVAGNDPYLLLNSTAAEVTGTDYIDTSSAGFEITSTAPAAINAVGGSYIFLAIS